jgi:ubiquinone/menaquinone biosynthesis C-methylase UbiE
MKDAIKDVQLYWDAYASQLASAANEYGPKKFFAEVKSQHDKAYGYANQILNLASLKGRSLLELGCGIGLDTIEFARHGADVTAIDLSPRCIDLAQCLLASYNLHANFELADAEELPHSASAFDIVVARGILMYTPYASRVVDELFRVLKPGGETNVLLHNRLSWYVFLAKLSGTNLFYEGEDPPINRLYSRRQAQQLASKFPRCQIFFDRFPAPTTKRTGAFAQLYNKIFVPCTYILPTAVLRPFGFYIIVKGVK